MNCEQAMISINSRVILLLCSHLGIENGSDLAPLSSREWKQIENKLLTLNQEPGFLYTLDKDGLRSQLDLSDDNSARIARLLERYDPLTHELERLASLGIHPLTCVDEGYPRRYIQRLRELTPPVLFYCGEKALLDQPGIAVVGSRNLDEIGQECAAFVGNACGLSGLVLYSGGAKGVDTISMNTALNARGTAVGILADSLVRAIRSPAIRSTLSRGDLCLATPYSPDAGFSVGAAMGRNRLIYTLADFAIVVASDEGKGGTWAGATETLRHKWVPVFILAHPDMPQGNRSLLEKGGIPFPYPFRVPYTKLGEWLQSQADQASPGEMQYKLFA